MRRVIVWFFLLTGLWFPALSQPAKTRLVYADRNYKEVRTSREAVYTVQIVEDRDTVYFETWNKTPKALVEKGKYPTNQGYDMRNCYMQRFWPDGKIRAEGQIKKTWNEGSWRYYDEEGILYSTVEYEEGLMTGRAVRYYPTGTRRMFTYQKNIRNGESYLIDTASRMAEVCYYKNDTLDGVALEYFNTGQLRRKTHYVNGLKRTDTLFWENGVPFACEKYNTMGRLEGRCMMYTKTKRIARYDEYSDGELTQNDCIHPLADETWEGDECPPRLIEASYPGGIEKYLEYVSANQDYPEAAIQWKQQGVVEYEFTVAPDGSLKDVTEENIIPLGFGLEKESLRLLQKIKKFEPQRINGRAVPVRIRMPYVFVLQE